MPKFSVNLSDSETKIIKARAKKNLLSFQEQLENIIRRSCVNYKENPSYKKVTPDDRLIHIFSREIKGKKRKN